jgi:release factor glutamine methyltransferase
MRQLRHTTLRRVHGVPIVVLPEVHDPVVFRTGEFLARAVSETPMPAATGGGEPPLALDMGTGSGIAALFAARRGYLVTAVDISPVAVRCARANVLINDAQDAVRILEGDLFAPVQGKQFDLVTFNPPFFTGEPRNQGDLGWRSTDVIERFAAGLSSVLRPDGRALIVFSSDADESGLLSILQQNGFTVGALMRHNLGNEVLTVYDARRHANIREPPS